MPYKSKQQERWAHTKSGEKALGGKAKVAEWDAASKGKKLPEKKETPAKRSTPPPTKKRDLMEPTDVSARADNYDDKWNKKKKR